MLTGSARALALEVLTLGAGVVWLWAGIAKLVSPFPRGAVEELVPGLGRAHGLLRWLVPLVEVLVGFALLSGIGVRVAGLVGVVLGGGFAVLHVGAMLRASLTDAPLSAGCGCFGGGSAVPSPAALPGVAGAGAAVGPSAVGPPAVDPSVVAARGWSLARAAALAMVTSAAVLTCPLCSG